MAPLRYPMLQAELKTWWLTFAHLQPRSALPYTDVRPIAINRPLLYAYLLKH